MDLTHSLHLECKKTDYLIASGRLVVNKMANIHNCALANDTMSSSINPFAINTLGLTLSHYDSQTATKKPEDKHNSPKISCLRGCLLAHGVTALLHVHCGKTQVQWLYSNTLSSEC